MPPTNVADSAPLITMIFTVLLQGLVSFFSPCVLPLLPVYMGYLSGGTYTIDEKGNRIYPRKKVLINTLFFVIGVSFAFFLLGLGMSALGRFFRDYSNVFILIGGAIIFLFGLYQLDVFGSSEVLSTEKRLPFSLDKLTMNPITALIMGFTFSFAWTPCVGPTLTSVLIMSAAAAMKGTGFMLIGFYTLGFVVPFLLIGFFTSELLSFLRKRPKIMKYAVAIGGILMVGIGVYMMAKALPGRS